MSVTAIHAVHAWEALDSRGRPTVACRVTLAGGGTGRAIVPAGASTGGHEARERRDRDPQRYGGWGVRAAVAAVGDTLAPAVAGLDATNRSGVDTALTTVDEDPLLGTVGANAVLAVSLAAALAAADALDQPLWRMLAGGDADPLLPLPMVNIVSGGAHAGGLIDIQDVLAVPLAAASVAQAIEWAAQVRAACAELAAARGAPATLVADEGGIAVPMERNEDALALVTDAIARAGLEPGSQVGLAVDIAANQISDGSGYRLRSEDRNLDAAQWLDEVDIWCRRYPVVSVEDLLVEDDWAGWRAATGRLGERLQLLGDDLFATNQDRLARGVAERVANAVLVKPNQAGTLTRAERVLEQAHAAGYATVVSARSGDTEDSWLADLAVGWRAGQIKVGSTTRSERTAKWNRLLEIESGAGTAARFAGRDPMDAATRRR